MIYMVIHHAACTLCAWCRQLLVSEQESDDRVACMVRICWAAGRHAPVVASPYSPQVCRVYQGTPHIIMLCAGRCLAATRSASRRWRPGSRWSQKRAGSGVPCMMRRTLRCSTPAGARDFRIVLCVSVRVHSLPAAHLEGCSGIARSEWQALDVAARSRCALPSAKSGKFFTLMAGSMFMRTSPTL